MRPLGLGETLDGAIKLTRDHIGPLVVIVLVVSIPIEIIVFLVSSSTSEIQDGQAVYTDDGAYVAGQIVNAVLRQLASTFVTIGCFHVIAEAYLGRDAGAGDSLKFAGRRLPKIIWTGLILLVLTIVLLLSIVLLFIPLIWFFYASALTFPVLLVEGTSGFAAIKRSTQLVKNRWWATFGRLLIASLIAGVTAGLLAAVLGGIFTVATPDSTIAVLSAQGLAQVIASALTLPFVSAVTIVAYFDLRVRKEGFDLAVLAEGMGAGPASPSPFAQDGTVDTPASAPAPAPAPPPQTGDAGEGFGGFAPPGTGPDSPERPD